MKKWVMQNDRFNWLVLAIIMTGAFRTGYAQEIVLDDITNKLAIEPVSAATNYYGHGISAADFDRDGDIDLYLCATLDVPNRLYENLGDGQFLEIANEAGIALTNPSRASLWFDYNSDGLLDLLVVGDCHETLSTNCLFGVLFQQNSDHTFIDVTESSGLNISPSIGNISIPIVGGLAAGDVNNDGFLDVVYTVWGGRIGLFVNNGNGTFSNGYEWLAGARLEALRWQPMVHDFDGDGWQDIYINVDFGKNEFFRNQGDGTFDRANGDYNINSSIYEMGMTLGDFDNDGDFDIFSTNINRVEATRHTRNILYQNNTSNGVLSFDEVAESVGVDDSGWGWGTTFADLNNDGWLDLAATNGHGEGSSFEYDSSKLWRGSPGGTFEDISVSGGFYDTLNAATLIAVDIDRDGDLDLLQTIKETRGVETTYPLRIYENQLIQDGNDHYLVVRPRMFRGNIQAIGAVVRATINGITQSRLISAGTSFYGQEPAEAFFGLGAASEVDEIQITWPDGAETIVSGVAANQDIVISKITEVVTPRNFTGSVGDSQVTLSWNSNSDYVHQIERVSADGADAVSFALEAGQYDFTDHTIEPDTEYKYRVRSVLDNNKSRWSGYWVLTVEEEKEHHQIDFDTTKYSVARLWNEVLLEGIRNDYARPTVHARNLFHVSAAMYDAWAVYDEEANPYFLNNESLGYPTAFQEITIPEDAMAAQKEAMSYAAYRLIEHRFAASPGSEYIRSLADELMTYLEYDISQTSVNYTDNDPAHLGNFIADLVISYGLQDGSNEAGAYENLYYEPLNEVCVPTIAGSQGCEYPNNWQPLGFELFIDQSGNEIPGEVPDFLSPEWGNVAPFSLTDVEKTTYTKDGDTYQVYHDPGEPALIDTSDNDASAYYKWNHSLVSVWSSHLDPTDQTMWDISPASIGNIQLEDLPTTDEGLQQFYNLYEGGDPSPGYDLNPITGQPYEEQRVPRADYGRVLAEFWADGPDSETPPGHWFTILNYVSDHPEVVKKYKGEGAILSDLEWDIKSYFMLGGTMHDAAISAWSIKGYYDYIRPISAIRYMADQGQSSDPNLPNYSEAGIPLQEGYIELVEAGDELAGVANENVGKIKLYAWRGPDYIEDEATDMAGVGWILAENWWPYQRPTFVTPPFAGYVSGHSTYSRAAASVLSRFTGSEYFPGGMGEFEAPKNEFLVFEDGPSVDVTLQWAKYYDASDQCSLSRIWGGIHPPVDDIPGRLIGQKIGDTAFEFAEQFFNIQEVPLGTIEVSDLLVYPNPSNGLLNIQLGQYNGEVEASMYSISGKKMFESQLELVNGKCALQFDLGSGIYMLRLESGGEVLMKEKLVIE